MQNWKKSGDVVTLTPAVDVASGQGCLFGGLLGIATAFVAAGTPGEFKTLGIVEHAKTSAQAWTEGALLYWDATNKVFTTTATSGTRLVGCAAAVAANPSAVGLVRLNGTVGLAAA